MVSSFSNSIEEPISPINTPGFSTLTIKDDVLEILHYNLGDETMEYLTVINTINLGIINEGHIEQFSLMLKIFRKKFNYSGERKETFYRALERVVTDYYKVSRNNVLLGTVINAYIHIIKKLETSQFQLLFSYIKQTGDKTLYDLLELTGYPNLHLFAVEPTVEA